MYLNRISRNPAVILFALLLLSLGVTYLLVTKGILVAPIVIILLGSCFLLGFILRDYRVGFYTLLILGTFMFLIDRLFNLPIPLGLVWDGLGALVFVSLFLRNREKLDWTHFKNPITIMFIILTLYQILELFNPSAKSVVAWAVAQRNQVYFLLYIICFHLFSTVKDIWKFTWVWMLMAFIVGAYGIWQEVFGLADFEMKWLHAVPDRIQLYLIWNHMRKFSILSDPSSFGLFMSCSALACVVFAMGPYKPATRIGYAVLAIICLVSMSYSGTRTAYAQTAVGLAFFMLMTLHNRQVFIVSCLILFMGVAIIVGPFYGSTANRIRSTFQPSDDPSMVVRDVKRIKLQSYILSHPIGGGLTTTGANGAKYSAGHYLAGGWDPDSGYLLTALEMGWIGLILFLVFFFMVMVRGIRNYFALRDPMLQNLNLAYIVAFLSLSVAQFTQDALFQKPANLIVIATYALIVKICSFERKLFSVDLV
jgi:putative inorganic carbon (hco3(-)) transporter